MNKKFSFCLTLCLLLLSQMGWAQDTSPTCPDDLAGFTTLGQFNASKYFLSNHTKTWQNASAEAAALGGYLVSISSQDENDFLRQQLGTIIPFIGYNDAQIEGNFAWDSGEAVGYTNLSGDGNNNANNDFAVMNFWNGKWTLENKWVSKRFIVEIPCDGVGNLLPDLRISAVQTPAEIPIEGGNFEMTVTFANDGDAPFQGTINFRLCASNFGPNSCVIPYGVPDANNINIPVGGTADFTFTAQALQLTESFLGNGYLVFEVDYLGMIEETIEFNNVFGTNVTFITNSSSIDLELSINSPEPNPDIFSHVPLTYTVVNNGPGLATGVRILTGVCHPNTQVNSRFVQETQIVGSDNPPPSASTGNYSTVSQYWEIPLIPAGGSATLDLTVFTLTAEERIILGQITAANQLDIDSSPSSMVNCEASEDDEAAFVLNEDDPPTGNEICQLSISNVNFPAIVAPGTMETITATVTNDGDQPSVPTQVNLYQLMIPPQHFPSIAFRQEGATVPALAVGASTQIQFDVMLPDPLYVSVVIPEETTFAWGRYTLVVAEDAEAGGAAFLNCHTPFEFEVDYADIDLGLEWVNNEGCYGSGLTVETDLRLTNHGPNPTTAPAYVYLAFNPIFINPNLNANIFYNPFHSSVYWIIDTPLAPGESITLTRPYRVVEGSTEPLDFNPFILNESSNIDDNNTDDNTLSGIFNFDENCGNTGGTINIAARVWEDDNSNGVRENFEVGIDDYLVEIEDQNSNVVSSGFTNAQGFIEFTGLEPGTYRVAFAVLADVGISPKNAPSATPTTDSDINFDFKTDFFTLAAGETIPELGAGIVLGFEPEGAITFRTWLDNNGDGVRALADGDFSNVGVILEDVNGNVISNAMTNSNGEIIFDDLLAGQYRIIAATPTGHMPTLKDVPGSEDLDSDINPDGSTDLITLEPGEILTNVSAGYRPFIVEDEIDLELSLSVNNTNPNLYQKPRMTYTLTNNSNTRFASNVQVTIGVCNVGGGANLDGGIGFFNQSNGLVNTSPSPSASLGSYNSTTQKWNIPELAPGETATLEVSVFVLTTEERKLTGQVTLANPFDIDSTPGNLNNCQPQEDDEAQIVLNQQTTDLPDFELSIVGYFVSTIINPNISVLEPGDRVPTGVLVDSPFHGVGGFSPIPNAIYNTTTEIYLSTDNVVDASDIVLNSFPNIISALGTTIFQEGGLQGFDIPLNVPLGDYYIIAMIDAHNDVVESDEANNTFSLQIELINGDCDCSTEFNPVCGADGMDYYNPCLAECIGISEYTIGACGEGMIDLSPAGLQFDNPVELDGGSPTSIEVNVTISNLGLNNFNDRILTQFCLSNTENDCDMELAIFNTEPVNIPAGGSAIVPFNLTIPVEIGTHFLVVTLDPFDAIEETDDLNNRIAAPITITNGVCTCEAIVDPVCGSNGVTYQNACLAECDGIFTYTPGECPTGDGIDLELEIIAPETFNIYNHVLFQVRVFNNGTVNAENVEVEFPIPQGFVHSENAATHGSYDLFREKWDAGTIKVGETAVLDLTLFALSNGNITAYSQVTHAEPDDVDSTPGNGTCCTPNEDDEDAFTISSNFGGDSVDARIQNSGTSNSIYGFENVKDIENLSDLMPLTPVVIKALYPNVVTDEMTIFVQSQLPELQLRVYNLQGNEVLRQSYTNTEGFQRLPLNVAELPTGTYILRFDGSLGRETVRFVKMGM